MSWGHNCDKREEPYHQKQDNAHSETHMRRGGYMNDGSGAP